MSEKLAPIIEIRPQPAPAPVADVARFSELRVLRWSDRITDAINGLRPGPIRASIDLTNLCNHACPWCEPLEFRAETIKDANHTLDISTVLEVLTDLAAMDCKALYLSGGGEPLLHPHFGSILRFAHKHGMRTWVVTNGRFIDKWINDILSYADHIRISLDASTEAEHAEMHGREREFVPVLENLVKLAYARGENRKPEIGVSYILAACNSNVDNIVTLCEELDSCGVDFMHFRPLSEPTLQRGSRDIQATMERIEREVKPQRMKVYVLGKRGREVFEKRDFDKCYSALTIAVISANGDLVACCDERGQVFGNVRAQSFKSLWLNATHRRLAEKIVPQFCQRCLQCGYNSAVERFVVKNEALPELL